MMHKSLLSLVLSAALAVPATAAMAHEPGTYESPIVEQRVKRFKQSGGDIQAIFKKHLAAGNYAAIEEAAARMAAWGKDMPAAFPEGSNSVGADAAIWENFSDFESKADAFTKAAMRLQTAAASGDAGATKKAAQAVGGTCKSCHQSYRIKH
jgi:cytochrome c556